MSMHCRVCWRSGDARAVACRGRAPPRFARVPLILKGRSPRRSMLALTGRRAPTSESSKHHGRASHGGERSQHVAHWPLQVVGSRGSRLMTELEDQFALLLTLSADLYVCREISRTGPISSVHVGERLSKRSAIEVLALHFRQTCRQRLSWRKQDRRRYRCWRPRVSWG